MRKLYKYPLVTLFLTAITGCGGGGGSDDSSSGGGSGSSPSVSPTTVISNAKDYSATQVLAAATSLADNAYNGLSVEAEMDIVAAQKAYRWMFDDALFDIPELTDSEFEELGELTDSNGRVEGTLTCARGGSIEVDGKINSDSEGNLSLTYTACNLGLNEYPLNGTVALSFISINDTSSEVAIAFNNLSWLGGSEITLNGYLSYVESTSPQYSFETHSYLTATVGDQSVKFDVSWLEESQSNGTTNQLDGSVYLAETGKVGIALQTGSELPPDWNGGEIRFTGDKLVAFEFEDVLIRYLEDTDGDDNYDVGTYFSGLTELLTESAHVKQPVSLDELTLPPVPSRSPGIERNWDIDASDVVEVVASSYDDPDTPYDELTVYYRWYVNGVEIENQNSATLPPEIVTYGDELQVAMVVSDGGNDITSERSAAITVGDAPAVVKIENLPSSADAGESVSFSALPYDPDIGVLDITLNLQSGPEGAALSDDGTVSWIAPESQMFGEQTYYFIFSFADPDSDDTVYEFAAVTIDVEEDLPSSSGAGIPVLQVVAGDFDHDGRTEILSRGSASLSMARLEDDYYVPVWAYPYKFPVGDAIKSIAGADIDGDSYPEIILATESAILVIDDLTKPAKVLHESDDYIALMTVDDFDGDGVNEVAYIADDRPESTGGTHLIVVSLQQPAVVLLDQVLEGNDVYSMLSGNVDNDTASELILSNGYVFDGADWSVQWQLGTDFGYRLATLSDRTTGEPYLFTGIFSSENKAFNLYSVVEQRLVDAVQVDEPCGVVSVDTDNDGYQEILASNCEELFVLEADEQALITKWTAQPSSDYFRFYSVTVGDMDGDSLPEVSWTYSSDIYTLNFDAGGDIADDFLVQNQSRQPKALGWPAYSSEQSLATFVMPLEHPSSIEYQLAVFDDNGDFSYRAVVEDSGELDFNDTTTPILDSDNNGVDEMLLQSSWGYFSAVNVSTGSRLNDALNAELNSYDWRAATADFNGDGSIDVVYTANHDLWAYDLEAQSSLGHLTLELYFTELVTLGNHEFVGAGPYTLSLANYVSDSLQIIDTVDITCSRITPINYDEDSLDEVLCLEDFSSEIIIFDSEDGQLVEVIRFESDYIDFDLRREAVEVVADPSTASAQGYFVISLVEAENDAFINYSRVSRFSHNGELLWDGTLLLGEPQPYQFTANFEEQQGIQLQLVTDTVMSLFE